MLRRWKSEVSQSFPMPVCEALKAIAMEHAAQISRQHVNTATCKLFRTHTAKSLFILFLSEDITP